MSCYSAFIPENTATPGAGRIGIYDQMGFRIGNIFPGQLLKDKGRKQYSFGALSDVHIPCETAVADFQKALTYLQETENVAFSCICGDLTVSGTDQELLAYKDCVDEFSPDTPVYAVWGNHDTYQGLSGRCEAYTGHPLCYSFSCGDDVFLMMGIISGYSGSVGTLFSPEALQWLYETLEANRNRRCFLFQHVFSSRGSGDALGIYPHTKLSGEEAAIFESLLQHYQNVIWFHGHSHMQYALQEESPLANYDRVFGCHSVHIPSLSAPRTADPQGDGYADIYTASEGYVVDVYPDGIHLRGRDFVGDTFLPIASYWLDTPRKEIPAGTYTDSTGIIRTTTV